MALNDTILNIGNAAMQTAITHAQIHTAQPNASGSNEATSARRRQDRAVMHEQRDETE